MKAKWIAAGLSLAAIAVPAVGQMDQPREGRRMGQAMTRADVEDRVKTRFAKIDLNRDGAVTREEGETLREQRREGRRDRAFARLDADGSGAISRDEFEARIAKREGGEMRQGMIKRRMMRRAMMAHLIGARNFARSDANNDGRVTLDEAMTTAVAAFDRADADRDGTVTFDERRAARMKMREEWRAKRG